MRFTPAASGGMLPSVVTFQIAALKIELQCVRQLAVAAGGEEQHQALFLDAADRNRIILTRAEARIFGALDLAKAHALDRRFAAREVFGLRHVHYNYVRW